MIMVLFRVLLLVCDVVMNGWSGCRFSIRLVVNLRFTIAPRYLAVPEYGGELCEF